MSTEDVILATAVFGAITAVCSLTATLWNAWRGAKRDDKISQITLAVDGNLSSTREELKAALAELRLSMVASSHARGVLEGKAEEKASQDNGRILPQQEN